ncbi:diacylglycerol/lipid kinase family protein [Parapedobacter sp.]
MKRTLNVYIVHNPEAGDQDHIKEELIRRVESLGHRCEYTSIREKGWQHFKNETDLVVIAGGDGTVREVFKKLLYRSILDKPTTVALIPSGTANNFAKSLGISPDLDAFERCLMQGESKQVDVGVMNDGLTDMRFFIEGLGYGLIPELIKKMTGADVGNVTTGTALDLALLKLLEIVKNYPATRATVMIDGRVYENNYLLVEVLNTRSIGPNLVLAPYADPTDGKFEVVLLKDSDREVFSTYLRSLRQSVSDMSPAVPWQIVNATREVIIDGDNQIIHVDDELIALKKGESIAMAIRPRVVEIITGC